jgi:acetylglutamate kinase
LLSATRFYFITNIKGVMDKNNKLIKEITPKKAKELIKKNIIKGGMIPKVETCLNAVKKSANAAVILDGRVPKLLLKEIFTTKGVGTLIGKK